MILNPNKRGFYGKGRPKFTENEKKNIVEKYLITEHTMKHLAAEANCSTVSVHKWVQQYSDEVKERIGADDNE